MWDELCATILACFGLKKLEPICEHCSQNLLERQGYLIELNNTEPKYLCEACIEKQFFF